jgi:tryptophan-rich sensory protein
VRRKELLSQVNAKERKGVTVKVYYCTGLKLPFLTSNIFTKMGSIRLKLCICTLVDILITIVVFLYKVSGK